MFVSAVCILDLYVFICALYLIITRTLDNSSFVNTISEQPVAMIQIVVTFLFGWCLCSLAGYHVFLISQGITTNEHIKGSANQSTDDTCCGADCTCQSCFANFYNFFTHTTPQSLLMPLKDVYVPELTVIKDTNVSNSSYNNSNNERETEDQMKLIDESSRSVSGSSTNSNVVYVTINGVPARANKQSSNEDFEI